MSNRCKIKKQSIGDIFQTSKYFCDKDDNMLDQIGKNIIKPVFLGGSDQDIKTTIKEDFPITIVPVRRTAYNLSLSEIGVAFRNLGLIYLISNCHQGE